MKRVLIILVCLLLLNIPLSSGGLENTGDVSVIILEEPTIFLGDDEFGEDLVDNDGTVWASLTTDVNVNNCEINWNGIYEGIDKGITSTSYVYGSDGEKTVYYRCYDDNNNFIVVSGTINVMMQACYSNEACDDGNKCTLDVCTIDGVCTNELKQCDGGKICDINTGNCVDNRPFASFTANPNPAACGQSIAFDASSSYHGQPDKHIVSYEWQFGDGNLGSGVIINHAYNSFNSYTAVLTVTDDNSPAKTDTKNMVINVNQGNQAPIAHTSGPYKIRAGEGVQLNGMNSYDPNTDCGDHIVAWSWDLNNDGSYGDAAGAAPALTWIQMQTAVCGGSCAIGNSYTIRLEVTDSFGAVGYSTTTINIIACNNGDTLLCENQYGVCAGSRKTCTNEQWPECDYNSITGYEATESLCDGKDNNCDGSYDEGLLNTYYQDLDGDNYGNNLITQQACNAPGGYVLDNADCDDTNAAVKPGATEVCNGIDDNCDSITDNGGDALCDNGIFCDGQEICAGELGCQVGTPPITDDTIACTSDSCDEGTDTILHITNNELCDNGAYCDGAETCSATLGCQPGNSVDCSGNNLEAVNTCINDPDNNPFTLDFREIFTSSCDEQADSCTSGSSSITSTCDKANCNAQCDANNECAVTDCDSKDGCVGKDYYDYNNVANTCQDSCSCTQNECGVPAGITQNDERCIEFNDVDADGVDASVDNCELVYNPEQVDSDGNGIGDACEDNIDGDDIPDEEDFVSGSAEFINSNINVGVKVGDDYDLNQPISGLKSVVFTDEDEEGLPIVEFDFDFSSDNVLDLSKIEITKQSGESSAGSIIIKGINLTAQGKTKTVYMDDINPIINSVCIKDAEIASIAEISGDCSYEDEILLVCPGSNGNYECVVEDGKYKISGLIHSGVVESQVAIQLYAGWNLISLPFGAYDNTLPNVLSSIQGNYEIVWGYYASDALDPWKSFVPILPDEFNDLDTMEPLFGYWIKMSQADTLIIQQSV